MAMNLWGLGSRDAGVREGRFSGPELRASPLRIFRPAGLSTKSNAFVAGLAGTLEDGPQPALNE